MCNPRLGNHHWQLPWQSALPTGVNTLTGQHVPCCAGFLPPSNPAAAGLVFTNNPSLNANSAPAPTGLQTKTSGGGGETAADVWYGHAVPFSGCLGSH